MLVLLHLLKESAVVSESGAVDVDVLESDAQGLAPYLGPRNGYA